MKYIGTKEKEEHVKKTSPLVLLVGLLFTSFVLGSDLGKSYTACSYPIVSCLVKASDFVGKGTNWQGTSDQQKAFLVDYFKASRREVSSISDIESIASLNCSDVNDFLVKRGFSIQLQPFAPGGFGVASVLDVKLKWLHGGNFLSLQCPQYRECPTEKTTVYPAVQLPMHYRDKVDSRAFKVWSDQKGEYVYELRTKDSKTKAFLSVAPSSVSTVVGTLELLKYVQSLARDKFAAVIDYNVGKDFDDVALVFPMVDLNQEVDLGWICELATTDGKWKVDQALGQNKLRINETGARAQSAVAMSMKAVSIGPIIENMFVIDQPYLFWIERDGLSFPLFAAYLAKDCWKEPENLDTN